MSFHWSKRECFKRLDRCSYYKWFLIGKTSVQSCLTQFECRHPFLRFMALQHGCLRLFLTVVGAFEFAPSPIFTYEACTQKLAGERGHVASRSRPSDRACERPRACEACFFLQKKPSNFTEINPQSRPFEWAGLPPARACFPPNLDLTGPNSARRHFSIFLRICYLSKTIENL